MRQAARAKRATHSDKEKPKPKGAAVLPFRKPSVDDAPSLMTATVLSIEAERVKLTVGQRELDATCDPSVSPIVIETAIQRRERVLVEMTSEGAVVIGVLRTQPTPGIDRAEAFHIEADRVTVEGNEVVLSSKTAKVILRAASEIESFAERIVSRAEGVHKIVGRMLRLN
jgi:hypothetical protein